MERQSGRAAKPERVVERERGGGGEQEECWLLAVGVGQYRWQLWRKRRIPRSRLLPLLKPFVVCCNILHVCVSACVCEFQSLIQITKTHTHTHMQMKIQRWCVCEKFEIRAVANQLTYSM